jgi:hypothetical protein
MAAWALRATEATLVADVVPWSAYGGLPPPLGTFTPLHPVF